jgi:hypothetical protein
MSLAHVIAEVFADTPLQGNQPVVVVLGTPQVQRERLFPIVGSGAVPATLDQFVVNLRGYSSMAPPTARRWSRKLKEGSFSRFVR